MEQPASTQALAPAVEPVTPSEAAPPPDPAEGRPTTKLLGAGGRWPRIAVVLAVLALLVLPFAIALVNVREPTWFPSSDLALAELRVRDVFSTSPPQVGVGGRIGPFGPEQGSHPGPLIYYGLAPVHGLLGQSSWALLVATATVHLVALVAVLWLAHRRGGTPVLLGVVLVIAVLVRAFGLELLLEPWNPYLPVMWWLAFLVAMWAVVEGDLRLLPLAVLAGSFCVQAHLGYAAPVLAVGALTALPLWRRRRRRRRDTAPTGEGARRSLVGWLGGSALLGVLVWLQPVREQFTAELGNLTKIYRHFTNPPEALLGLGGGLELLLVRLDPIALLANSAGSEPGLPTGGTIFPGGALLLAEAAAIVVALRLRRSSLLHLHLLLVAALVAAAVSLPRIIGAPFDYLTLWLWTVSAMLLLAIGLTASAWMEQRLPGERRRPAATGAVTAWAVGTAVIAVLLVTQAAAIESPDPKGSRLLASVLPGAVAELSAEDAVGGGRDGRYLVTWSDPGNLGFVGYGLLDGLERKGFTLGVDPFYRTAVTASRVFRPAEATAELHLAIGSDIEEWRSRPSATELAYADWRTTEERAQYAAERQDVVERLRTAGLDDLVGQMDDPTSVGRDSRVGAVLRVRLNELAAIGMPAAVFVAPA